MKKILLVLVTSLAAVLLAACGGASEPELKDVTLMLDWTPNTNHTGLYVAQAKGWYAEAGLNVEIVIPGETDVHQVVGTGSADFGVSYQEGLTFARVEGVPVVSVAAVIQHNTSGFASRGEKGINGPADLAGKRYGSFGSPIERPTIDLLMACTGGSGDTVEFVDIGWADFLSVTEADEVDFAWIFYGWDGINAELKGIDLNVVMLNDWQECVPDYYTPVIITGRQMIDEQPDVVEAFLSATTQGYEYAINNPEEAAEILLQAAPESDPDLIKASQEWLSDQYQADAERWGEQSDVVWQRYADWLFEEEMLAEPLDMSSAFSNDFLPAKGS